MIKRISGLALLLVVYSLPVLAQPLNKAKLDSLFDAVSTKTEAAGSIAVYKQGEGYSQAFGNRYISLDQTVKIPNDTATMINIGSITKTFVATLVFQLIDEGELTLTDTLSRWFPEVPNAGRITIEQMLGHRSGLENYMDNPMFQMTYTVKRTEEELLNVIRSGKPAFEPGEKEAYSNAGYVLLRKIVEKTTGMSFLETLRQRIFDPLGMQHTGLQPEATNGSTENIAQSYLFLNNNWIPYPETHVSNALGAGGMVSTPNDLTVFVRALFNGKLVSESSLSKMKEFYPDGRFGLGLARMPYKNHEGIGHTGGIDAYRAIWLYYPDEDILFAGCFNNLNTTAGRDKVAAWVLAIAYDEPLEIPSFDKIVIDSVILDRHTGVFGSKDLPLDITVSRRGDDLWIQATGQAAFSLEAVDEKRFKQDGIQVYIEFKNEDEFTLIQGRTFHYTRKKDE